MGKKKASVDSDYSGRPLDRPPPEDLDDTDWHDDLADLEGIASADGSFRLVAGHDDHYYYPGRNGWPDYDRGPIDPDTGEPIAETGPEDTSEAMGDILSHTAAGGELMTSGERLRQEGRDEMRAVAERRHREGRSEGQQEGHREGRLEGQREGRLEMIDGFLRTGVDWSLIKRATGIGEQEYQKLKSQPNGAAGADGDRN